MLKQEVRWIRKIQKKSSKKEADLLVRSYYDEIYRFVYRQTMNMDTAMDLTQEIFAAVLRAINSYNETKSSFRTWLYRIAANKIIDYRRHQKVRAFETGLFDETMDLTDRKDSYKAVEQRELLEKIEIYVSELGEKYRVIFQMRFYGEFTLAEIAEKLEEPEATIKTRYYKLIKKLREEFKDEYTDAR